MPEISVIMSVYNAEKYLKEAIESILSQDFEDFEFIIINDGSTDNSKDIIYAYNDPRIKIISQDNHGLAKSLNTGIEHSTAKYIARMDSDDVSLPFRLSEQYKYLECINECIAVGSNAEIIDEEGNFIYNSRQIISPQEIKQKMIKSIVNNLVPYTPFFHSSVVFRRKVFNDTGKYPEFLMRSQDVVLFYKMLNFGELHNIDKKLIKYRIVPVASTPRGEKNAKYFSNIIKKIILDNKLSQQEQAYLQESAKKANEKERKFNYHLYLVKKYLWTNYNLELARKHIFKALQLNYYNFKPYALLFATFLPQRIVQITYHQLKKN